MARKTIEVRTTLIGTRRLNCSSNGNPRFELITTDGRFTTQSDAACSYDVDNIARRIPDNGLSVLLRTTPAGRVWSIEAAQ